MKMHNTIAVLVGLVILAMPWPARAVVIFSTYDGTTAQAGGSPINRAYSMMMGWEGQRVAVSFSPGSQSYGITSITVNAVLYAGKSNDFNLGLYDNDSGHPGTLIGYLSNPGGIGSQGNYIFTANSLKVESNTTYWIIGEPSLSTESQFTWCFGTSGTSRGENYRQCCSSRACLAAV